MDWSVVVLVLLLGYCFAEIVLGLREGNKRQEKNRSIRARMRRPHRPASAGEALKAEEQADG